MLSVTRTIGVLGLVLLVFSISAYAGRKEVIEKTFDIKESVRINTVSGDCIVKQGDVDKIHVHLVHTYRPDGSFEPEFEERGKVLRLSENHYESNSGRSVWTITVPAETRIRFSTASGDFEAVGMNGDLNAETASGDMAIENCTGRFDCETASGELFALDCKGEFEFSSASGDVRIENCNGTFNLESASGDVEIDDSEGEFEAGVASGNVDVEAVVITAASSFETASGDVDVILGASSEYDLVLSTASGSATLDYDGHPISGSFEFVARERRGRIVAPFDFDDEDEFERWGQDYVRKSFKRGSDGPMIAIETASGRAELIE